MTTTKTPWQPLSELPWYANRVSHLLTVATSQRSTLRLLTIRHELLCDETISELLEIYTQQLIDQIVFEQQLNQWQQESLSDSQIQQLNMLTWQAIELKATTEEILQLTRRLAIIPEKRRAV